MSIIRLMRDPQWAPCCFILARAPFGARDERNTVLIQSDWDFPGVAREFGWNWTNGACDHDGTDGTVDCPACGRTAGEFIAAASEWLHANVGAEASDPGYFTEDQQ